MNFVYSWVSSTYKWKSWSCCMHISPRGVVNKVNWRGPSTLLEIHSLIVWPPWKWLFPLPHFSVEELEICLTNRIQSISALYLWFWTCFAGVSAVLHGQACGMLLTDWVTPGMYFLVYPCSEGYHLLHKLVLSQCYVRLCRPPRTSHLIHFE